MAQILRAVEECVCARVCRCWCVWICKRSAVAYSKVNRRQLKAAPDGREQKYHRYK